MPTAVAWEFRSLADLGYTQPHANNPALTDRTDVVETFKDKTEK